MPTTPELSLTGLDEYINERVVENCKAMSSKEELKVVKKHDDAPIIKEWVSDDEEKDVSQPKIEKKTVRPSIVKIKYVKSKQQEKTARKIVKQVEQNRVVERRNRTLIEAARTMLADSKLPIIFWPKQTPTLSFMRPFGRPLTILNTIDHLGKFDGKVDKGFFVGYSMNSKAFRVFNSKTRIVEENLHIRFSESTPNVIGSGPDWLFDIDALTRTMNYEPIVTCTQSNGFADPKSYHDDGSKPSSNNGKKVDEDLRKESECNDHEKEDNVNSINNVNTADNVNTVSSTVNTVGTNEVNDVDGKISIELPFDLNMHALEDVSIFNFSSDHEDDGAMADMNNLDTTIQDEDGREVDVYMYRSMIGSLMYLTSSRPDITFAVCACARYQVYLKVSHLYAMKRNFRVLDLKKTKTIQHNEIAAQQKEIACLKWSFRIESFGDEESLDDADKEMLDVDALNGEEVLVAEQKVVVKSAAGDLVSTASILVSAASVATTVSVATTTTATITTVDDVTLAQALEKIKNTKPKVKGLVIHELGKSTTISSQQPQSKAALKLQAEFNEEERLAREKAKKEQEANISLIETWDDIQAKINVDHQFAERMQAQEQEELSMMKRLHYFNNR
nr:hypothetical protein [Tanacetum cinerariifolium]